MKQARNCTSSLKVLHCPRETRPTAHNLEINLETRQTRPAHASAVSPVYRPRCQEGLTESGKLKEGGPQGCQPTSLEAARLAQATWDRDVPVPMLHSYATTAKE